MEQFINDNRFRSVEIINLHNGGEVLLHPKLKEMLALIKQFRDTSLIKGQKFPRIFILTNAMKLTPEISKILIDSEIIDVIGFSLDGGTPEMFSKMRHHAIWDVVYKNIRHFEALKKRKDSDIESYAISCIPDNKDLNTNWMHPEFKEILNLIDRYELRRLHNWAGEIEHFPLKVKKHKIGCTLLMQQMVLLPEGDVTLCCNDLNSKEILGNIYTKNFYDIYKSKKRRLYLRKHLKGQNQDLKLCSGCETF
jgi:radical SAM protein with 4Fe4S-binding SPASM domain